MRTFCDKHGNVFMSNRFSRLFQAEQISLVLLKVNFGVFVMIVLFDDPFNLFLSSLTKRNENANHEAFTVLWNSNVLHYYCVFRPAAGRAAHFCSRCLCCHPCQDVSFQPSTDGTIFFGVWVGESVHTGRFPLNATDSPLKCIFLIHDAFLSPKNMDWHTFLKTTKTATYSSKITIYNKTSDQGSVSERGFSKLGVWTLKLRVAQLWKVRVSQTFKCKLC